MRAWVAASWVAVGLVLLSGAATAHPAGTMVTADDGEVAEVPAQTFEEAFCLPMCNTQARGEGNVPPVIVTESGTTLAWDAIGGYHSVTSDTETGVVQEDQGQTVYVAIGDNEDQETCLNAPVLQTDTTEVLFEIGPGGLYVTDFTAQEPTPVLCDEAGALPDGGYAIMTHCEFHPRFQHQLIHVVPAGTI